MRAGAAAAIGLALWGAGCGVQEGPLLTSGGAGARRAPLVAWGTPAPRNVADLDAIAPVLAAGPAFDGFVLDALAGGPWSASPLDVAPALALGPRLAAPPFQGMRAHLLSTRVGPGAVRDDDDAGFATVAGNFAAVARAARAIGARGLMLDTQTYYTQLFSFPDVGRGRALADAQRSLRARGAAIMRAMLAEFPALTVVVTIGYAEVWRAVCTAGGSLATDRYGLLPAFLDGLRDALGPSRHRQLVDGFLPSYATRTPGAFAFLRAAIAFDEAALRARSPAGAVSFRYPQPVSPMASWSDASFPWSVPAALTCPPEVRAQLERRLPVGFGLMIDFASDPFAAAPPYAGNFHTPASFGQSVDAARRWADDLVWLYAAQVDWWPRPGSAALPADYLRALAAPSP